MSNNKFAGWLIFQSVTTEVRHHFRKIEKLLLAEVTLSTIRRIMTLLPWPAQSPDINPIVSVEKRAFGTVW